MGIYEPRNLCGQAKTSKGTEFEARPWQNFYLNLGSGNVGIKKF